MLNGEYGFALVEPSQGPSDKLRDFFGCAVYVDAEHRGSVSRDFVNSHVSRQRPAVDQRVKGGRINDTLLRCVNHPRSWVKQACFPLAQQRVSGRSVMHRNEHDVGCRKQLVQCHTAQAYVKATELALTVIQDSLARRADIADSNAVQLVRPLDRFPSKHFDGMS